MSGRSTYKYHFKVGHKRVRRGIVSALVRRRMEPGRSWPTGHIRQIGQPITREGVLPSERAGDPDW